MSIVSLQDRKEGQFQKFEEIPNFKHDVSELRSFFNRVLGKMEVGALRGAIFTLISTCIGAGCLTLPLVFERQGIVLALILLFIACFCAYLGVLNISYTAEHFKCYGYSDLVGKVLGKNMKLIFDNTLILYVFGSIIGYQVMVGSFVPSIFSSLNINLDPSLERYIVMIITNIVLMMPLSLMRTLTSLRFISILSALTLVYITLLIIIEFPFYISHNSYDNLKYFHFDLGMLPSYNICLYAFTCHTNVAQIYDELNNRNLRRMGKVASRAMTAVLLPYIMLGMFGYLSVPSDTPQLIIMRRSPHAVTNDWLMVIARILMTITLIIAVPINVPPCRACIAKTWFKIEGTTSTKA